MHTSCYQLLLVDLFLVPQVLYLKIRNSYNSITVVTGCGCRLARVIKSCGITSSKMSSECFEQILYVVI
jgi:hypothetical protein